MKTRKFHHMTHDSEVEIAYRYTTKRQKVSEIARRMKITVGTVYNVLDKLEIRKVNHRFVQKPVCEQAAVEEVKVKRPHLMQRILQRIYGK